MKKILTRVLALMAAAALFCVSAAGLANPWTDTDADGLREAIGFAVTLPDNAEEAIYRLLAEQGLAEVQYTLDGIPFCFRVKAAEQTEDISGMYYEWESENSAAVGQCEAVQYTAQDTDGNTVELCLWYDSASGRMYSLSTSAAPEGFDMEYYASAAFLAMNEAGCAPFIEIAGIDFYFSSGAGGWWTRMTISPDGSFTGEFHDSEMGDMGDEYPNGSVYGCTFEGSLRDAKQISEYVWQLSVESLTLTEGQPDEYIEDGIRYVTVEEPYGLEGTETLLLYMPGMPIDELPEGFLIWAHLYSENGESTELPCYGLYDEAAENGFVGYDNMVG